MEQPEKVAKIASLMVNGMGANEAARACHVAPASLRQVRIRSDFDGLVQDQLERLIEKGLNIWEAAADAGQLNPNKIAVDTAIWIDKKLALSNPDHIRQTQPQSGPSVTDILAELKALPGTCQAVQINVYQGQSQPSQGNPGPELPAIDSQGQGGGL